MHPRGHAPGRHVDDGVGDPAGVGGDAAALDRPHAERDRAVPARRGEPVLVPEQDAEVRAVVVGFDDESAVHVGVPARLVAQDPADPLDVGEFIANTRLLGTSGPSIAVGRLVTMRKGSPPVW